MSSALLSRCDCGVEGLAALCDQQGRACVAAGCRSAIGMGGDSEGLGGPQGSGWAARERGSERESDRAVFRVVGRKRHVGYSRVIEMLLNRESVGVNSCVW